MSEALGIAKNLNTSPEQLQQLLSKNPRDKAILSAIAVHPDITKKLLIEIACNDNPVEDVEHFKETDRNLAIDSLLLEHPDLTGNNNISASI